MGNDRWLVPAGVCCLIAALAAWYVESYMWVAFWVGIASFTGVMWIDSRWLELLDGPEVVKAVEPAGDDTVLEVAA